LLGEVGDGDGAGGGCARRGFYAEVEFLWGEGDRIRWCCVGGEVCGLSGGVVGLRGEGAGVGGGAGEGDGALGGGG